MATKFVVTTDQRQSAHQKLTEITRQVLIQPEYGFNPDDLNYHLQCAIEGRFIKRPQTQQVTSMSPFLRAFKSADTNLNEAIMLTERFAQKVLGLNCLDLRKQFDFPTKLPWKNVLVIYDPGTMNNRQTVELVLQGQKLKVREESDVMEYSGAAASGKPTVCIIENSLTPTTDTMNKTPNQLIVENRPYLSLRGYALAFALRYFDSKDYLDSQTWTWFPNNLLSTLWVAHGHWGPCLGFHGVRFDWHSPGSSYSQCGARLVVPVSPKA